MNISTLKGALLGAFLFVAPMWTHAQIQFKQKSDERLGRFELIRTTVSTLDDDFVQIVQRPIQNPNLTANAIKAFALVTTDYQTTKYFQQHIEPLDEYIRPYISFPTLFPQTPVLKRWARGVDGYMYTGVAGMYAAGFLIGNEKMQEAGALTTKAVVESYIVSHLVLKTVFARHRPARLLGELGTDHDSNYPFVQSPLDFFNFHVPYLHSNAYGTGFPSYHATMFFAFASTMSRVYDNRLIPYSLATTALLYDIRGHNHWVSELVAGAVIGNFIGKVVYENHQKAKQGQIRKRTYKVSRLHYDLGIGAVYGQSVPSLTVTF